MAIRKNKQLIVNNDLRKIQLPISIDTALTPFVDLLFPQNDPGTGSFFFLKITIKCK